MDAWNNLRKPSRSKMPRLTLGIVALGFVAFIVAVGCTQQARPPRYVALSLASEFETGRVHHPIEPDVWVGIGPIRLPGYLARSHLLIAQSRNVFKADEQVRWAEAIEDNFSRVLAGDLAMLVPDAHFIAHPWSVERAPKFSIRVDVQEFHADASGTARLIVRWEWVDGMRRLPGFAQFVRNAASKDSEAIVAALSSCLADFSRRLAAELGHLAVQ